MSVSDVAILFNQILKKMPVRILMLLSLGKSPFSKKSYLRLAMESLVYNSRTFNPVVLIAKKMLQKFIDIVAEQYGASPRDILEIFKKPHYIIGLESVLKGALIFGVRKPFVPGAPFLVVWDYTYRCNLRCKHCYIDAGMPRKEMSYPEKVKALDILADTGVASIALSGGEPLLGEGIFDIIKRGKDYGIHMSLATNGTLITKEVAEKLAKIGLDYVQISLDSPDPKIHDSFRGVPGAFNRTIRGIKNALEAGLTVEVAMTVTRFNVDQVNPMLNFLKELGVPLFMHFNFIPTGRGKDIVNMDIDPDTREQILRDLVKKSYQGFPVKAMSTAPQYARIAIQFSIEKEKESTLITGHFYQFTGSRRVQEIAEFIGGCGAGRAYIALEPNGDIQPCVFMPIKIGNILKDNFRDLWIHNEILNKLRNRDILTGKCGSCPYRYICGGCRARAYAYFGDYLAPDPGCIYNRDLWEKLAPRTMDLPKIHIPAQ